MQRSVRNLGIVSAIIIGLCLLASQPIVGIIPAIRIAAPALAAGMVLGGVMAAITKLRNPTLIYMMVIVGVVTVWPLHHPWPEIRASDFIHADSVERSEFRYNYLELLRIVMYLLGMPFPYACFGQHASDPVANNPMDGCEEDAGNVPDSPYPDIQ